MMSLSCLKLQIMVDGLSYHVSSKDFKQSPILASLCKVLLSLKPPPEEVEIDARDLHCDCCVQGTHH